MHATAKITTSVALVSVRPPASSANGSTTIAAAVITTGERSVFIRGLRAARSHRGLRTSVMARCIAVSAALNRSRTRPSGLRFAPLAHSKRWMRSPKRPRGRTSSTSTISRYIEASAAAG